MSEKKESILPSAVLVFTVVFAFTLGGIWIGILSLVIGLTILGWNKRNKGPFTINDKEQD